MYIIYILYLCGKWQKQKRASLSYNIITTGRWYNKQKHRATYNHNTRWRRCKQRIRRTNAIDKEIHIGNNTYQVEASLKIPKINLNYPVISETSDELLKISVNKFHGPKPNEAGNYCIVGHNYRNGKMFGRLRELEYGDNIELQDLSGRTINYKVYNKYIVNPTDTSCTSQRGNDGKMLNCRELTLITCTNYGTQRLIVKCREVG